MHSITSNNTDVEVQAAIGERLRALRVARDFTVDEVAVRARLNRNTVANAEAGRNPGLVTIIRIVRVLGRLDALDALLPAPTLSPLDAVKGLATPRRRASGKRSG